ncbi:tyrosine-type recombinase/integrase [Scytonema sp. PCC 10023]|uniref:tyrosine-type recombinase/integrase n=1 Tax=Scytonema sp. PCC 10023 TaxID=1680591 RepID=UPI0039C7384B
MNQDKWIYTDKRSGKLVLRFRVKGYDKQFFIGTGLTDTPKNRKIARARRDLISSDITLERFDSTLESYRSIADRTNKSPAHLIQTEVSKNSNSKYAYNLAQLWQKFTEFKQVFLEQTTISIHYHGTARYIRRLPTQSLEKAPEIRNWLLSNTTHQMAWQNLLMFSHCCEWAVDSGLIPNNPFAKLKIKKPKKASNDENSPQAFTLEQRDIIIQAFEQHPIQKHYASLMKFLFWTGCRHGEAFALTWGDIRENCTRVVIDKSLSLGVAKGTKNNKKRIFPAASGSKLQQMLLQLRPEPKDYHPANLVFKSKTGKPLSNDLVYSCWSVSRCSKNGKNYQYPGVVRELAAKGIIPYLKPYSTRHTFATWAISSGVSPDKVAVWIGDEVQTVLQFYCHPDVVESECPDF